MMISVTGMQQNSCAPLWLWATHENHKCVVVSSSTLVPLSVRGEIIDIALAYVGFHEPDWLVTTGFIFNCMYYFCKIIIWRKN